MGSRLETTAAKISNRCPTVKSRNRIFSRHGPPFMVKTLIYNMNYLLRQMNKEKLHHKPNTKGEATPPPAWASYLDIENTLGW
jgi:hypothetical protein